MSLYLLTDESIFYFYPMNFPFPANLYVPTRQQSFLSNLYPAFFDTRFVLQSTYLQAKVLYFPNFGNWLIDGLFFLKRLANFLNY